MQVYSDDKRNYEPLVDAIGLFFQIRDDLANLCSKEYADSKSYCEDLTEGKFSYPVIHSLRKNPNDNELIGEYYSLVYLKKSLINRVIFT